MSLVQEQVPVPQVIGIDERPEDNKYFIKAFLVNDKLNKMGWKLNPAHIDKNIKKFIGRPLVLTKYLFHPHELRHYQQTGDIETDLKALLQLQKPHEIGNIVDIQNRLVEGGMEYTATIEVTNENAVRAMKEGKIPTYVSPAILRKDPKDPWYDIRDFEALHLSIVDNPAFGVEVANIRRPCEGAKNECLNMLAQGGEETPIPECPYAVLQKLSNVFEAGTIVPKSRNELSDSSIMSEPNVPATESAPKTETVQEQNIDSKIQEQKEVIESQKTPIGTPAKTGSMPEAPNTINPPGSEEQRAEAEDSDVDETPCAKAARELESKIAEVEELKAKMAKVDEFIANSVKKEEQSAIDAKMSEIEKAVPENYADSEEERAKVVAALGKLEGEELKVLLRNFAQTRRAVPQRKHTDFLKNEPAPTNIAQAGMDRKKAIKIKEIQSVLSLSGIVPNKEKGVSN